MPKFFLLIGAFIICSFNLLAQGSESFINIPTATPGSYLTRNWTGDNTLAWTATDARTDQTINGKAICVRNGSVTCNSIPNGVGNLTLTYQQVFTGSNPVLEIYINSVLVGSVNPSTTVATSTLSNINVSGNFNLEIRQVTAGLRISIDDVNWTSYGGIPCIQPANQPTNLILTPTPTTMSVSFTAAVPAADEYMVVRSTSSTLSASPVDGILYPLNSSFGGGTIVSSGTSTSFVNTGLSPSTLYYYFVFALNSDGCSGGPNYFNTTPLTNSSSTLAIPPCTTPSSAPTNLVLNPGSISVSGNFTAAAGANRYLVVRSLGNSMGASPVNGTTYSAGQSLGSGTVVTYTSNTNFTALGLTQGTVYYFYVFSANGDCTGEPFYNMTSLNGNTTTLTGNGIPPGYYNAAAGLNCAPLKTALFNIISANYNQLSYTPGVWNAYQTTDQHRNDANTADIIWDMYSDNPTGPEPYTYTYGTNQCGSYTNEGDCYNREHSFPKAWFNDAYPMYSDLNHLFPTDGKVNGIRDNFPYGEVSAPVFPTPTQNGGKKGPNTYPGFVGTVFEPINEYKGDLARAHLYMVTRYENLVAGWQNNSNANDVLNGTTYPALDDWDIKLMYKWHTQDPVSQKEIDRNNAVYALQGNRNPFIDHPEYVYQIWNCTGLLPVTLLDFSAVKNNETVLLKWQATRETSFKEYEIQRSTDGTNFYKTGIVPGRNFTNYDFTDLVLPVAKTVYYRLKMIDIDGKFSYSKTVAVRLTANFSSALVYPNPAKNLLNIKFTKALGQMSTLQVTDAAGRVLMQQAIALNQNLVNLDTHNFEAGRYFIKIINNNEVIIESFIVIK